MGALDNCTLLLFLSIIFVVCLSYRIYCSVSFHPLLSYLIPSDHIQSLAI